MSAILTAVPTFVPQFDDMSEEDSIDSETDTESQSTVSDFAPETNVENVMSEGTATNVETVEKHVSWSDTDDIHEVFPAALPLSGKRRDYTRVPLSKKKQLINPSEQCISPQAKAMRTTSSCKHLNTERKTCPQQNEENLDKGCGETEMLENEKSKSLSEGESLNPISSRARERQSRILAASKISSIIAELKGKPRSSSPASSDDKATAQHTLPPEKTSASQSLCSDDNARSNKPQKENRNVFDSCAGLTSELIQSSQSNERKNDPFLTLEEELENDIVPKYSDLLASDNSQVVSVSDNPSSEEAMGESEVDGLKLSNLLQFTKLLKPSESVLKFSLHGSMSAAKEQMEQELEVDISPSTVSETDTPPDLPYPSVSQQPIATKVTPTNVIENELMPGERGVCAVGSPTQLMVEPKSPVMTTSKDKSRKSSRSKSRSKSWWSKKKSKRSSSKERSSENAKQMANRSQIQIVGDTTQESKHTAKKPCLRSEDTSPQVTSTIVSSEQRKITETRDKDVMQEQSNLVENIDETKKEQEALVLKPKQKIADIRNEMQEQINRLGNNEIVKDQEALQVKSDQGDPTNLNDSNLVHSAIETAMQTAGSIAKPVIGQATILPPQKAQSTDENTKQEEIIEPSKNHPEPKEEVGAGKSHNQETSEEPAASSANTASETCLLMGHDSFKLLLDKVIKEENEFEWDEKQESENNNEQDTNNNIMAVEKIKEETPSESFFTNMNKEMPLNNSNNASERREAKANILLTRSIASGEDIAKPDNSDVVENGETTENNQNQNNNNNNAINIDQIKEGASAIFCQIPATSPNVASPTVTHPTGTSCDDVKLSVHDMKTVELRQLIEKLQQMLVETEPENPIDAACLRESLGDDDVEEEEMPSTSSGAENATAQSHQKNKPAKSAVTPTTPGTDYKKSVVAPFRRHSGLIINKLIKSPLYANRKLIPDEVKKKLDDE